MLQSEFKETMIVLHRAGLKRTPGGERFTKIMDNWYKDFENIDLDLLRFAIEQYKKQNDSWPTYRQFKNAINTARKTYSASTGEGFDFSNKLEAQTIEWGIQLADDIRHNRCTSEQQLKRTQEKVQEGVDALDKATPGFTKAQKNELFRKISVSEDMRKHDRRSHQEFLSDLALEVQGG